jgi:hypothetical protein
MIKGYLGFLGLSSITSPHFVRGTDDIGGRNPTASPEEVALYIGALTVELGQLARANGLDALGYILDMARLEADEVSKCPDERDR